MHIPAAGKTGYIRWKSNKAGPLVTQFKELRRRGYLPDLIAHEIMQQVNDGRLLPGDALPTETALAASFGVSRNVVREAIARLRSDGVIKTKQGRGACVLPTSERATFRVDMAQLGEAERLSQLFELRGLLEIDAAGIAAQRRSEADLAAMQAAIDEMGSQQEFDKARLEGDANFHRALGAATQNEYLTTIVDYLSGRLQETKREATKVYEERALLDATIAEHQAILETVRAQDTAGSRDAMARHICNSAGRLGVSVPKNL